MEDLLIAETSNTPLVKFNMAEGRIEIKGKSLPEDPVGFYEPLNRLLDEYLLNPCEKTIVNLEISYFNSSSSKHIFQIFQRLEMLSADNKDVVVNWYCEEGDEFGLEEGEDFKSLLEIPFNLIEVP